MQVTVAVCTWNRSALLRQTLASLATVRVPAGVVWEVLVVENGCTDDTASVVAEAGARLPVRLIAEPRLGLSHARNAAAGAARGRYLVWVDDDVLVDPDWLEAYCDAFAAQPGAAFFGGPIRAWFPAPPPVWLARALPSVGNAFSLIDYGALPMPLDVEHLPFGANFAVRADVQRRHAYRPDLGRRGHGMRSGEETAMILSVLSDGGTGMWVPGAAVRHYVSPGRQSVRYLRRYYFHNGAADAVSAVPDHVKRLFGRPRWVWREAVTHEVLYWVTRPLASPAVWGRHLRRATTAWGRLRGSDAGGAAGTSDAGGAAGTSDAGGAAGTSDAASALRHRLPEHGRDQPAQHDT